MKLDGKHDFLHQGEYKNTIFGLLPKDWTIVNLKDISIEKGTYGIGAAAVEYDRNLPRYLRITDIDDNGRLSHDDPKCLNDPDYVNYILKNNDIVFARTGNTTGKSYLYKPEDGLLVYAGFLIKFSINPLKADSRYVKFFTETNYYWQWVKIMSMRSGQPGINEREYGKLKLPIPCLLEQKKIADILETWDKAIELKEKLIEQKKEQKKGLMQKLLTGEVRLPGFKDKWKKRCLDDICVKDGLVRGPFGGALKKEYFVESGYKVYEQKNAIYKDAALGEYYIDENKFTELKRFEVQSGDFIISCSGTIGRIFRIPNNAPKGVINQALLKIRIDNNVIDSEYFYQYFQWGKFQNEIVENTQGGAMRNLVAMDIFRKTIISVPTLLEQKKIGQILYTLDKEIELHERELLQIKQQKKGLMQLLLTGKVRVQV